MSQPFQYILQLVMGYRDDCLHAPACEYLICMMVVMVMAAASMAVVMVMAFLPVMVVLMAFPIVMVLIALFPIVMVLMALFPIVVVPMALFPFMVMVPVALFPIVVVLMAFFPIVVVPMALFPFMVMMLMAFPIVMLAAFPHLCQKVIQHGVMLLNDFKQLFSVQAVHRRGNDDGLGILPADHVHVQLDLGGVGDVRAAEHDGSGVLDLVVEEFAEILHVHLALVGVHNGHGAVQLHLHIRGAGNRPGARYQR